MSADQVLAAAGLGLAFASAALPWHVWSNPGAYGPPRIAFERLDDDPAFRRMLPTRREAPGLVTGGVASSAVRTVAAGEEPPRAPPIDARPRNEPRIVYATATYALARFEGRAELALLRPGSRLDGGDRVERFALSAGRWVLVTARGRRLAVAP